MIRSASSLAALALLGLVAALPARADSSFASSASESISASSAKISDSLSNSSQSSSNNGHTAQGDYTVTRVAAVEGKPGLLRLHLQPTTQGGDEYDLLLPRAAAAQGRVAPDVVVSALQRPYGIAFATTDTHEPFFLALQDDWAHDLNTTAVRL